MMEEAHFNTSKLCVQKYCKKKHSKYLELFVCTSRVPLMKVDVGHYENIVCWRLDLMEKTLLL